MGGGEELGGLGGPTFDIVRMLDSKEEGRSEKMSTFFWSIS